MPIIKPILHQTNNHCISSVMISMLVSSSVDLGIEPWTCQTKSYKIGICCFSAKQAALRSKSKDWLAQNRDNVSEWVQGKQPQG